MSTTQRPVLFLGATGGCANSALIHALRSSIPCIALARNPSKLSSQLTAQSVTPSQLANLTIIPGNALNVTDLKTALLSSPSQSLPRTIVTGLGATPHLELRLGNPVVMDDPHICENAARALVTALREIYAERPELVKTEAEKPSVVFVSTTGISRVAEDVPFVMRFLYHQILAVPHLDKRGMEDVLLAGARVQEEGEGRVFRVTSGVRPTLLAGAADVDDGLGWEKIRAGKEEAPEMGYTVKRADVGEWVFENLVREGERRREWEGQIASLTS